MDVKSQSYRFILLIFNCMLTFGSFFCYDMPSAIQRELENMPNITCLNESVMDDNNNCCSNCLGLGPVKFNLLFAVHAWTGASFVILEGYFIDKVGNRIGAYVFSLIQLLGTCLFALAGTGSLCGSNGMFLLMLSGRILLGLGNYGARIVQDRVTAFWFRNKELAMAFGITVSLSRLGSVLSFLLCENLVVKWGLTWTLWGAAVLCATGVVAAVGFSAMDIYGVNKLGKEEKVNRRCKRMKLNDIKKFHGNFWLLTVTALFLFSAILSYIADSSQFIEDKYNFSAEDSSYIAGMVYDIGMLASPLFGWIVDTIGGRGIILFTCSVLTSVVFACLAFTHLPAVLLSITLGFCFTLATISVLPSVPLIVPQGSLGTAMGIVIAAVGIGCGLTNIAIGKLLSTKDRLPLSMRLELWFHVLIFLVAITIVTTVFATLLNVWDKKQGGILNLTRRSSNQTDSSSSINSTVSETDPLVGQYSRWTPTLGYTNPSSLSHSYR